MAEVLELGVDALAVWRLTRLIRDDDAGAPVRTAVSVIIGPVGDQAIACPWCLPVWVAAGAMLWRRLAPRSWAFTARVAALAAITSLLGFDT